MKNAIQSPDARGWIHWDRPFVGRQSALNLVSKEQPMPDKPLQFVAYLDTGVLLCSVCDLQLGSIHALYTPRNKYFYNRDIDEG